MVEIREARREDEGAIASLWFALKESNVPEGRRWSLAKDARSRFMQHLVSHFLGERFAAAFVAEEGEEIIGYIACEIHHLAPVFEQERSLHIDSLQVRPGHHRQGVGRLLVERALRWGRNEGATAADVSVAITNDEAIGFLHALGFKDSKLRLSTDL